MKRMIVLFLVVILFSGLVVQTIALEKIDYAEIWGVMAEEEKFTLLLGIICSMMQEMILIGEYSRATGDIEIIGFVSDYIIDLAKYSAFYGEDINNMDKVIGSIDGFYSDPDNKYCNPASLAYISYLYLQGEDISEELIRLRVYAELIADTLFKK